METRGFFIRRKGTDGYQFGFKPTLKKVISAGAKIDRVTPRERRDAARKMWDIRFRRDNRLTSEDRSQPQARRVRFFG